MVAPSLRYLLTGAGIGGLFMYVAVLPLWTTLSASLLVLLFAYFLPSPAPISPIGKAVFITGCDSGFGWFLAKKLDSLGFCVFAGCLFPEGEGAEQLKESSSERIHIVKLDVTDDKQIQNAVQYVRNNLSNLQLWALVNNAGIAVMNPVEWCPMSIYEKMLNVNTLGLVRVTKAFLPDIRKSRGRITNIASVGGRYTIPSCTAYSMSKHAIVSFSDGLRREMSKFGVKVSIIEPGGYRTNITDLDPLIAANRKEWLESTAEVRESYGDEFYEAYIATFSNAVNTSCRCNIHEVIDVLVASITDADPRYVYHPHWTSRLRRTAFMYISTALADRIISSLTLPKVPVRQKTE